MDWFGIILFMIIYYIVDRYFKKKELPVWKRELFSFYRHHVYRIFNRISSSVAAITAVSSSKKKNRNI